MAGGSSPSPPRQRRTTSPARHSHLGASELRALRLIFLRLDEIQHSLRLLLLKELQRQPVLLGGAGPGAVAGQDAGHGSCGARPGRSHLARTHTHTRTPGAIYSPRGPSADPPPPAPGSGRPPAPPACSPRPAGPEAAVRPLPLTHRYMPAPLPLAVAMETAGTPSANLARFFPRADEDPPAPRAPRLAPQLPRPAAGRPERTPENRSRPAGADRREKGMPSGGGVSAGSRRTERRRLGAGATPPQAPQGRRRIRQRGGQPALGPA